MKRCEFATISPLVNDNNNMPMLKKEASQFGNTVVSPSTYHLPGDISLNIEEILRVTGISLVDSSTGLYNQISSSQSTLCMGGSDYEIPQNCDYSRQKASSSNSMTPPSLFSSISQHNLSNSMNINNGTLKRVSVINSDENFLHYELYNPTLQMQQLPYFEQNSQELLRQLEIVSQLESNQKNQYLRSVQETIRGYVNSMNEVKNICSQKQMEASIDEKLIETIHSQIKRIRSQTIATKYYTYSIYVIDSNQVYREVQKGISQNLSSFISGSQQNYVDHILRFGDADIFDATSRAYLSLSRMQSTINSQQYNAFNIISDNNMMICRLDGKCVPVNCQSSLIPLSEPMMRQQKPIYYAYMRMTEITIDEQYCEQSCADSSCSSNSPNSMAYENSHMYEEYLQNCQQFQEKYYGKGSLRKKRYRKTKAQVEQELKYYLSLNVYNQQQ